MKKYTGLYAQYLSFRELGLSIGLHALELVQNIIEEYPDKFEQKEVINDILLGLEKYMSLSETIEKFWMHPKNQKNEIWALATCIKLLKRVNLLKLILFLLLSFHIHAFLSLFYLLALNGVMYQLNLYINLQIITLIAWLSPMFGTAILLMFPYYFFEMRTNYPKLSVILKSLIGLNILFIFIQLLGFYVDEAFLKAGVFLGLLIGLSSLFLFTLGLYVKEVGSKYYLIGQIILFAAVTLSTLGIFGVIPYYEFYRYLVTVAISIDMIFLLP